MAPDAADAALALHPSLQVVRSRYPVVTIWELTARDGEHEPVTLPGDSEDALVVRPKLDVEVRRLPAGGAAFLCALRSGATLQDAAVTAMQDTSSFDLEANLAGLMASGAIVGIRGKRLKS